MAEIKKRITQLDPASGPLDGVEVSAVVQGGVTKKITESNKYGAGWWDKLKAAFVDFVAPEADHANNADTLGVGLEEPSDFHDAAQLTGVLDLARIPVELTGKNASTADYADTAGTAATADYATEAGSIGTIYHGSISGGIGSGLTYGNIAAALLASGFLSSAGDKMLLSGAFWTVGATNPTAWIISHAEYDSPSSVRVYGVPVLGGNPSVNTFNTSNTGEVYASIAW